MYLDLCELLARPDADAFLSATGECWHALIAIEPAKAGRDAHLKKPVSFSIGEARAQADMVRCRGRNLQIGTRQRSWYQLRAACELVCNGDLGGIQLVTADAEGNASHCLPGHQVPRHEGRGEGQPRGVRDRAGQPDRCAARGRCDGRSGRTAVTGCNVCLVNRVKSEKVIAAPSV